MNIDLIDRCLYERTCDVRWWATDSAVVDALAHATPHSYEYATRRLGVILKAYTVYLDLVLADHTGIIMAMVGQTYTKSQATMSARTCGLPPQWPRTQAMILVSDSNAQSASRQCVLFDLFGCCA